MGVIKEIPTASKPLQTVPTKVEKPIACVSDFKIKKGWALDLAIKAGLPKEFVEKHADKLVAIAKAMADAGTNEWERVAKNTGKKDPVAQYTESLQEAYKLLPQDMMAEHSDIIIEIARVDPLGPAFAYQYFPKEEADKHPEEILRLVRAAKDEISSILIECHDNMDIIMKNFAVVEKICAAGATELFSRYGSKEFAKAYLGRYGDLILGLAQKMGKDIDSIVEYMPPGLTDEQFKRAVELFTVIAESPKPPYLSSDDYSSQRSRYEFMLTYFYKKKFGSLPPTLKKLHSMERIPLPFNENDAYREAVKNLVSTDDFRKSDYTSLAKSCSALMDKSNKEFGITEFYRYAAGYMLEQNIANLDPKRDQGKPVAVIVHNKADWNMTFSHMFYIRQLERLGKYYRVICFETDTEEGLFSALEKSAAYGKIDLVVLGGHGTQIALQLGKTDRGDAVQKREDLGEDEAKYLDVTDEEQLRKMDRYLAPDAKAILVSCSTGKGGETADNLANAVSRAFNGKEVFASPTPTFNEGFHLTLDESGKFKSVWLGSGEGVYVAKRLPLHPSEVPKITVAKVAQEPQEAEEEAEPNAPAKKAKKKK